MIASTVATGTCTQPSDSFLYTSVMQNYKFSFCNVATVIWCSVRRRCNIIKFTQHLHMTHISMRSENSPILNSMRDHWTK